MSKSKRNWIIFTFVILFFALFYLLTYQNVSTGNAILNLNSVYTSGEPLRGALILSLKEGELIPASSAVVLENGGNKYEYTLSDYISEETQNGNFYVEGLSLKGGGEGYGVDGSNKIYPLVNFKLRIISSSDSESVSESSSSSNSASQGSSQRTEASDTSSQQQTEPENQNAEAGLTEEQTQTETSSTQETQTSQAGQNQQTGKETKTETKEETKSAKSESKAESKETKSGASSGKDGSASSESEASPETPSASPITGNVISGFFGNFFKLFLGITGRVSLNTGNEIDGQVSAEDSFTYELAKGQSAEIVPGSVTSEGKEIGEGKIKMEVQDGKVIVTTDYRKTGTRTKDFVINLSKINLPLEQGDLKVSLIYENLTIVSLSTTLSEGELNASSQENETNVIETPEVTSQVNPLSADLTAEEKNILLSKFGNVSVNVVSAEQTTNGKKVKFEIGDYWANRFYGDDLSQDELNAEVQRDMALFLKDIARGLLSAESKGESIEGVVGSYSIK